MRQNEQQQGDTGAADEPEAERDEDTAAESEPSADFPEVPARDVGLGHTTDVNAPPNTTGHTPDVPEPPD